MGKQFFRIAFVAVFVLAPTLAGAQSYSRVVVFGDSLSDTGNSFVATGIPPSGPGGFPYFEGRFSNGPIWIDILQEQLGLADNQVLNFAIGGSSTGFGLKPRPEGIFDTPSDLLTPTIGVQIDLYLAMAGGSDSNQLTILWAGSNDLFTLNAPSSAVNNIESHIRTLADSGADEFLIPGLSPLGTTPSITEPFEAFLLNFRSYRFNRLLNRRLNALESELGITIHRVDTFGLTVLAYVFPQAFGLTNTTDIALADIQGGLITPGEGATYFYWDPVHPTSTVHQVVASAAFRALAD